MGAVVGAFAVPLSTGNVTVTSLPFEPVAVIFWNDVSPLGPHSMCMGCATSSSDQWVMWTGTDTETSGYTVRYHEGRTDRCVFATHAPFTTVAFACSFVSMNSDGFTVNFVTRNSAGTGDGNVVYYMALGGRHISQAHAGTVSIGGSTGTTAVTAPGFQPTCLMVAHNAGTFDAGQQGWGSWGLGFADATTQFSSYVAVVQGVATSMRHVYRTDSVASFWDGSDLGTVALDSLDANGFTLDVTDAFLTCTHAYLALDAEAAVVGHGVQPDSDTVLSYSTPGLKADAVLFAWPGADTPSTSGSSGTPLRPGFGGGDDTTEAMISGIARSSAPFGVWTSDGYILSTEPMGFWGVGDGIAGGSNQSQASANITDLSFDSFELTWSNVLDTNDRVFGWLALPGELPFHWIPNLYRRQT